MFYKEEHSVKKNLEQFKVGSEYRCHKSECHLLRTLFGSNTVIGSPPLIYLVVYCHTKDRKDNSITLSDIRFPFSDYFYTTCIGEIRTHKDLSFKNSTYASYSTLLGRYSLVKHSWYKWTFTYSSLAFALSVGLFKVFRTTL